MNYRKTMQGLFYMDEGYTQPLRLASNAVQPLSPAKFLRLFRTVARTILANNIFRELNTKKRPNLNALKAKSFKSNILRGFFAEIDTLGNKGRQDYVKQNFDAITQSIKDCTSKAAPSAETDKSSERY
ncbi:uncharacterized protein B0P05DRAFT_588051 [Gilbertella persicaria]|uniref:uncharacterized protein n=1 Tax=Gilbertella persicaria TaxID=101096 RepID=UPI002220D450|nr:uncharacterized protein B0P05DRAFT_588051 [Gilbertella persicaria]KAI8076386.1 hypothetical protein B0P05DRAFT_588051 [Gilbertella persicaria]